MDLAIFVPWFKKWVGVFIREGVFIRLNLLTSNKIFSYFKEHLQVNCYTPGIYAEGYIVFVFPFICLFARPVMSIEFVEFTTKFYLKNLC